MVELCGKLMKVLSINLGLGEEQLQNAFGGENIGACLRVNFYPKCPQPDLTLGLSSHSDPGGMTLLLPDSNVPGLQVRKDGNWITVKPVPHAFIVNIGDQIQVTYTFSVSLTRLSIYIYIYIYIYICLDEIYETYREHGGGHIFDGVVTSYYPTIGQKCFFFFKELVIWSRSRASGLNEKLEYIVSSLSLNLWIMNLEGFLMQEKKTHI